MKSLFCSKYSPKCSKMEQNQQFLEHPETQAGNITQKSKTYSISASSYMSFSVFSQPRHGSVMDFP